MQRREFVGVMSAAVAGTQAGVNVPGFPQIATGGSNPEAWRTHFPALQQSVNGRPLVYLDTAATALRPAQVIDAISSYYRSENANPGSALHTLARRSAQKYDEARRSVARFINASDPSEVVFTRGTTEGLNLVAATWAAANLRPGDNVVVGVAEHASNMMPWQMVTRRTGAELRYFGVDDEGRPLVDDLTAKVDGRTRVVAFSHVSNVLGLINPAQEMCSRVRRPGRIVVIDGAQSVPHFPVDVQALGCDFLAFSSHKMLGPMGVGVLWGRRELLDAMPPYQGGSNMAHDVDIESLAYSDGALKFGAGTPNVAGPVGLSAAIDFLRTVGHSALWEHEQRVTSHMVRRLQDIRGVRLLGAPEPRQRISVFSFTVQGSQPSDVLRALDERGIAVRAGDLASLPLLKRFGTTRAARASCYLYTTLDEVDRFATALDEIVAARRP